MRKSLVVTLLLLLAGGFALREILNARSAQQTLEAAEMQAVTSNEKVRKLTTLLAGSGSNLPASSRTRGMGAASATVPPRQNPKTTSTPPTATPYRPWLTRVLAENPALHALYLDAYRKNHEVSSGLVVRHLGLSADEAARYHEIFAKDMERATDIAAVARSQNVSSVDPAIKALNEERKRERDEAMRALLRSESRKQRAPNPAPFIKGEMVGHLAATLYGTPTPLAWEQVHRLTGVLSDIERRALQAGSYETPHLSDSTYASLITKAEGVLSPAQMEVLQTLVAAQRAKWELHQPPPKPAPLR